MRGLTLSLAVVLAMPAFAQDAPAPAAPAPKTKRVCKWIETGNPLDNKRICQDVAVKQAPAAPAPTDPAPAEVALQTKPHG